MTPEEAIKILEKKKEYSERIIDNFLSHSRGEIKDANETIEMCDMAISALKEIQQYREIGTVEECREAAENQKAKNPSVHKQQYSDAYNCSKCGWTFIHKNETGWFCGQHYKFCPNCGQAIRWNENLEGRE